MKIDTKRFLLGVVPFLVLSVNTALGQPAAADPPGAAIPHFGIKAGAVLSGYEGDEYQPYLGYEVDWIQNDAGSPDVGFQLGLFYSRPLAKHWAIQPGNCPGLGRTFQATNCVSGAVIGPDSGPPVWAVCSTGWPPCSESAYITALKVKRP